MVPAEGRIAPRAEHIPRTEVITFEFRPVVSCDYLPRGRRGSAGSLGSRRCPLSSTTRLASSLLLWLLPRALGRVRSNVNDEHVRSELFLGVYLTVNGFNAAPIPRGAPAPSPA